MHTHTHTHTYVYIYICIYLFVYIYIYILRCRLPYITIYTLKHTADHRLHVLRPRQRDVGQML